MRYEWQKNLEENLATAAERDPREFSIGYFSGGTFVLDSVRVFQWFSTIKEAAEWLREAEPKIAEAEELPDLEKYRRASEVLIQNENNLEKARLEADDVLGKLLSIEWLGKFDDLISGDAEFARQVRMDFWSSEDDSEDVPAPIPAEKQQAFVDFLREYGV